jgi:DNA repair protein RadC
MVICESDIANLPVEKQEIARGMLEVLANMVSGNTPDTIRSPQDVYQLSLDLVSKEQEHFVVYCLNSKHHVINRKTISVGSLNSTVVHPREVFRAAIENSSASIICVHNHPSGDPTPSPEDISVTQRLCEAGEIIGIELIDHVIVGRTGWFSLKANGHI